MKNILLLELFLLLFTGLSAFATDRFFMDITAKSPNGRFIATAVSSDNQNGQLRMAFQKNFTFMLRDALTNKTIWTYLQKENDISPIELIPTDNGYLIIQDATSGYHVFDRQGNPKKIFNIFELFTKEEIERFTDDTTAGRHWSQHSKQGFFPENGKKYFYIMTYWGNIAIIDIRSGIRNRSAGLAADIEDHLIQGAKEWIKKFDNIYFGKCDSCNGMHLNDEISGNVFIVKKYNLAGGKKILKEVINKADDGRNYLINDYLKRLNVTPYPVRSQKLCGYLLYLLIALSAISVITVILLKRKS